MSLLPLNCEISPSADCLDQYHAHFRWVPSSSNIRSDPLVQARKNELMSEIQQRWASPEDFILFQIFAEEFVFDEEKQRFVAQLAKGHVRVKTSRQPLDWRADIVFKRNAFPYRGLRCEHWVLWYRTADPIPWRETITNDVKRKLMEELSLRTEEELLAKAQFVWYENPKRNSFSAYFHVQVFWTLLP